MQFDFERAANYLRREGCGRVGIVQDTNGGLLPELSVAINRHSVAVPLARLAEIFHESTPLEVVNICLLAIAEAHNAALEKAAAARQVSELKAA